MFKVATYDGRHMADPQSFLGQAVSPDRVIEKLGGCGKGGFYKAEDTEPKRFVTFNYLPEGATRTAKRLNDFEVNPRPNCYRTARTSSSY